MKVIIKPDNETVTDHYNQLHSDEKTLWRLACEWNNQDPHTKPGQSVHLTDDNPFTKAWQECYDRKRAACPIT
jgi:hypothetical protein